MKNFIQINLTPKNSPPGLQILILNKINMRNFSITIKYIKIIFYLIQIFYYETEIINILGFGGKRSGVSELERNLHFYSVYSYHTNQEWLRHHKR